MTGFNPFGTGEGLPASLGALVGHPERGRWQAAIMLQKVHSRWPSWPLEHALAVVDSALGIHQADFLMMPPIGWQQKEVELPNHLSTDQVIAEGLLPGVVMSALNTIFGDLRVYTNASMASLGHHSSFAQSAGLKPTWKQSVLFQCIGDCLTVALGEHAHVEFRAFMPTDGDLAERAHGWARAYVRARLARQLFMNAALGSLEPDHDASTEMAISSQALEELKILRKIEPRIGTVQAARDWYEKSPLPGFGSATAKQLVEWGQSNEVLEYIEAVDAGAHA